MLAATKLILYCRKTKEFFYICAFLYPASLRVYKVGSIATTLKDLVGNRNLHSHFIRHHRFIPSLLKPGTGIGLYLTKAIVEMHKGRFYVESVLEQGSTFFVELPLGNAHLSADEIIEKKITVSEVSTLVGFNSHSYFCSCFKAVYGCSPTEYMERNGEITSF